MIHYIMIRPKHSECGNGRDESSPGLQQFQCVSQPSNRALEMLQYIEHQDQRILFAGCEVLVERADVNTIAVRIVGADKLSRRLNALNLPKFLQAAKEETVSTTDVKDRGPTGRGTVSLERLDNIFSAGAPPPVGLEQIAVTIAIVSIQAILPWS